MRLALVALTLSCAFGETPSEPPALLRLIRDAPDVPAAVRRNVPTIELSAVTGVPAAWTLELFNSFGDIEEADLAGPAANSRTPRTTILLYMPSLSYRADQALRDLAQARYVAATWYEFQAGQDAEFHEIATRRRASLDRVNYHRPELVYVAFSGTSASTYVVLAPLVSLKALDNGIASAAGQIDGKLAAAIGLTRQRILLRVGRRNDLHE